MSKIITIWGGNNSGKTTFAANLACALSKQELLVGIISSNFIYGELQIFFGQEVPAEKGLYAALDDENPNIGEKFTAYGESKNLFFLSVPTRYSGLLCDTVALEDVERMINAASVMFDVLLVDGAAEINNPLSSVGLWLSDTIFTLHRPSISAQMWYTGVSGFIQELYVKEKLIHVLQSSHGTFDDQVYQNMTGLSFAYELPYVKCAAELENAGTPLYYAHDRPCKQYGKVLDQITRTLCGGEKSEK